MDFVSAVKKVLQENYMNFEGRASRSEYWWFLLFVILAEVAIAILAGVLGGILGDAGTEFGMLLYAVFGLAVILPALGVTVRRLHDTDRSGWFIFIGLVPVIGPILLIVWYCTSGTPGANRFGANPLGA
jgi:uncharacterized membrane protein YhaH (DUF805 family)